MLASKFRKKKLFADPTLYDCVGGMIHPTLVRGGNGLL